MGRATLLALFMACWMNCSGTVNSAPTNPKWDQSANTPPGSFKLVDVEIEMRRLGSLGRCPVYTVILKGDGSGVYEGTKYVKTRGRQSLRIEREAFKAVLQGFYDIHFFTLTDSDVQSVNEVSIDSLGQVTVKDVPEQIVLDDDQIWLSVRIGAYHKEVHASAFWLTSSGVWALGRLIDRAAGTGKLTGQ